MPLILVRISMISIQYRWLGTNLEVGEKSVNRLLSMQIGLEFPYLIGS